VSSVASCWRDSNLYCREKGRA